MRYNREQNENKSTRQQQDWHECTIYSYSSIKNSKTEWKRGQSEHTLSRAREVDGMGRGAVQPLLRQLAEIDLDGGKLRPFVWLVTPARHQNILPDIIKLSVMINNYFICLCNIKSKYYTVSVLYIFTLIYYTDQTLLGRHMETSGF